MDNDAVSLDRLRQLNTQYQKIGGYLSSFWHSKSEPSDAKEKLKIEKIKGMTLINPHTLTGADENIKKITSIIPYDSSKLFYLSAFTIFPYYMVLFGVSYLARKPRALELARANANNYFRKSFPIPVLLTYTYYYQRNQKILDVTAEDVYKHQPEQSIYINLKYKHTLQAAIRERANAAVDQMKRSRQLLGNASEKELAPSTQDQTPEKKQGSVTKYPLSTELKQDFTTDIEELMEDFDEEQLVFFR